MLNGSLLYNRLCKWEADGSVSGTWVPLSERGNERQTGRRYKDAEVGQGRVALSARHRQCPRVVCSSL